MESNEKLISYNQIVSMNQKDRLEFLMSIGALVQVFICIICNIKCRLVTRKTSDEYAWRCTKCAKYYSIKCGSFFEHFNRTSIIKVIEVIEYWAKERKLNDMEQSLNISKPTLIRICKYLRQLCFLDLQKENFRCGGRNRIVEIDESVFNKVKYKKGKDMVHYTKQKQLWVFGIKDRSVDKCFFQVKF